MKVQVPYLSRIEGHAHLVVDTKAGEVVECQLEEVETPRTAYFSSTAARVRSTGGVVHEVRVGGTEIHPDLWTTLCGWRFARLPHERCEGGALSCQRCSRARDGSGGVRAGQGGQR